MLLLIILLVLLFGGGGGYYGYSRWGTRRGPGGRRNGPAHSGDRVLGRRVTLTFARIELKPRNGICKCTGSGRLVAATRRSNRAKGDNP